MVSDSDLRWTGTIQVCSSTATVGVGKGAGLIPDSCVGDRLDVSAGPSQLQRPVRSRDQSGREDVKR